MLVSVSTALVSSFVPSTQLRISHSIIGHKNCFTSLYFFSTHDFTILCNSHDFFLTTEGWANYLREHDKNWHICCCFSLVLHNVKFKIFSLWLGLAQNMDIKSVPYTFTFGMISFLHLNWQACNWIHTTSFSDSFFPIASQNNLPYLSFWEEAGAWLIRIVGEEWVF